MHAYLLAGGPLALLASYALGFVQLLGYAEEADNMATSPPPQPASSAAPLWLAANAPVYGSFAAPWFPPEPSSNITMPVPTGNDARTSIRSVQIISQSFILLASPLWSVFLMVYDNSFRGLGCTYLPCIINLALWYSTYVVLWPIIAEVTLVIRHMTNFQRNAPPGSDSERFAIRQELGVFAKDVPIAILQSVAFHLLSNTATQLGVYTASMCLCAYSLYTYFYKRFQLLGLGDKVYLFIPHEYGTTWTKGPCCCSANDVARVREQVLTLYTMWSNVALSCGFLILGAFAYGTDNLGLSLLLLLLYLAGFIAAEVLRCKDGGEGLHGTGKVAQDPNFYPTNNGSAPSWETSTTKDYPPFPSDSRPHGYHGHDTGIPLAAMATAINTSPAAYPASQYASPPPEAPPSRYHVLAPLNQPPHGVAPSPGYPWTTTASHPGRSNPPGGQAYPPPPGTPPPYTGPMPYGGPMPYNTPMPYNAPMPVYPSYPTYTYVTGGPPTTYNQPPPGY